MRPAVLLVALACLAGCGSPDEGEGQVGSVPALACPGIDVADRCDALLPGVDVNEFSLAANPLDPKNAIVTANDFGAGREGLPVDVGMGVHPLWGSWWFTKDAGTTWQKSTLPGRIPESESPLFGYEYVGDLVVEFAGDGTAYMAGIGYSQTGFHNALFVTRSDDGGASFGEPTLVDSSFAELVRHDKPALLVAQDGSLVIVWNFDDNPAGTRGLEGEVGDMRVAISHDRGATWDAHLFSVGDDGISASLAQAPDGTIHCTWRAYEPNGIHYARSTDGGGSWSAPEVILPLDITVTATRNANYRTFVLPALTVTPEGVLHVVAAPKDEEFGSRVQLGTSLDGGESWAFQVFGGTPDGKDAFLPAIASAPDGRLAALWLDRRLDGANAAYNAWSAVSVDGIEWQDLRLSSDDSPAPEGSPFIGDYLDIAIAGPYLYAAWPDLREGGSAQLRVAVLEFTVVPVA